MAIASTLEADFSDFVTETMKANAAMKEMQREAIATAGSVSGTASSMDAIGSGADKSAGGVNKLSTSLRTADKTLGAFGVQIGPQISAIEEMEQVSGKTAAELGVLGTAMSVAGAAMAGWNIGRWIADITGADKAIADFASTLMGWGSVSQQTAEYQKELIARAQQLDPAVRTAADAFKVLQDAAAKQGETFNTGAARVRTWTNDLNDANTDQAALRAEIERGNSTVEEMSRHYNVSTRAVQYFTKQIGEETQKRKEAEAAAKAQAEAAAEVTQAITGESAVLDTLTDSERAATEAALAAGVAQSTVAKAYGLSAVQVRAVADAMKEAEKAVKDFDAAQKIADEANAAWNSEIVARSMTTTAKLIDDVEAWRTKTIAALEATGGATQEQYDKIEAIAAEKLTQVKLNWDVLRDGAIASYADTAARAEATYAEMLAHSTRYTTDAIANALKLRDESLASYEAMSGAHGAAYAEFLKRDQAYAAALKQFQTEAASDAQAKWDAEAAALDKAIAYSQTYGVTIDAAKQALGMMGAAGKKAGDDTGAAMAGAAQQVGALTAVVQQSAAQMETLSRVYDQMAQRNIESGSALGTQIGMNYEQSAREIRAKAGRQAQYEEGINPSTWTRNSALTVTVNNADAQGIANRLIEEMRHNGARFG